MRKPRDRSRFRKVHLRPEGKTCPVCKGERRFQWNNQRRVRFVGDSLHIDYHVYACVNPDCALYGLPVKPEAMTTRVLPNKEFGLDVLSVTGYYRLKDCLSFPKIAATLRDLHKVEVSQREVEDMFDLYVALTTTDVRTDPELVAKLKKQGRIVLTIDAAKPDRDGEALWLIRDHISEEVLMGFTARRIDAEGLAEKIREVASVGVPIAGAVSDGEQVIIRAVELALPGTPHQLCQFHFLRDFGKGVTSLDSELKKRVKEDLKGLNRFEDAAKAVPSKRPAETGIAGPASLAIKAQAPAKKEKKRGAPRKYERLYRPGSKAEAGLVRDTCEVARAVLDISGKPPLDTPGLETYDKLAELDEILDRAARKKGVSRNRCAATSTGRSAARATMPRR